MKMKSQIFTFDFNKSSKKKDFQRKLPTHTLCVYILLFQVFVFVLCQDCHKLMLKLESMARRLFDNIS